VTVEYPSPRPRRISTPRWFDLRLVLGIVLVLAAVLVGAVVVSRAEHTDKELAVTRDLAVGTRVQASDLRLIDVQLPDDVRHDAAYLSDPDQAVGKTLNRALRKGELVPAAVLAAATTATTVSVPFAADAAPALTRGQRIVVWLSTATCPSVVLLPDVTVQDVHTSDSGGFSTSGTGQDVVVSVAPRLAQRVVAALAIQDATIRAGVLTGSGSGSSGTLPSLHACGPSSTP
jgi:hypothetical protein